MRTSHLSHRSALRRRPVWWFPLAAALLWTGAWPGPGAAQVIEGRLLADPTDEPISGAVVTLLNRDHHVLRTVSTTDEGAFSIRAPGPGRYHLRGSRIGYEEAVTSPFDVLADEVVEVEFHLSTEAILLAPLTVVGDRPALVLDGRLERWGYYERKELYGTKAGFGRFLDREAIDRRVAFWVSDLLWDVPGIRVQPTGRRGVAVRGRAGRPCAFYLDGMIFRGFSDGVVIPSDLAAVEVYPGMVAPGRFGGEGCVIALWTAMP